MGSILLCKKSTNRSTNKMKTILLALCLLIVISTTAQYDMQKSNWYHIKQSGCGIVIIVGSFVARNNVKQKVGCDFCHFIGIGIGIQIKPLKHFYRNWKRKCRIKSFPA